MSRCSFCASTCPASARGWRAPAKQSLSQRRAPPAAVLNSTARHLAAVANAIMKHTLCAMLLIGGERLRCSSAPRESGLLLRRFFSFTSASATAWLTSLPLRCCQSNPRSTLSTGGRTRICHRSTTSSKTTSSRTSTAFGAKPARSTTVPRRAPSRPAMYSRTLRVQLSSISYTSAGVRRTTTSTR